MTESGSRGPSWVWVVAAGALALLVGLAATPLFDPDEPVYAQAGLEMLQRGNLMVPWFDGRPWFDKPVLFYALEAVSQRLLGPGPRPRGCRRHWRRRGWPGSWAGPHVAGGDARRARGPRGCR